MLAAFRAAPFGDIGAMTGGGAILVRAPRPDDESLGFGGTIAAAVAGGIAVHIAVLTDGTGSHPGSRRYPPPRLKAVRAAKTRAAAAVIRLDIATHLPAKRRAIAAHAAQTRRVIDDSPDGFRLDPLFLALFDRSWEVLILS